jgi:hypothetical protein
MQLHTHNGADRIARLVLQTSVTMTQLVSQQSPLILYRHCHRPWLKYVFGLPDSNEPTSAVHQLPTFQPKMETDVVPETLLSFEAHSQNCHKRLWTLSCLSVYPHGSTQLPLDEFSLKSIFFPKSVEKIIQVTLKSDKNIGYFTWRPIYKVVQIWPGLICVWTSRTAQQLRDFERVKQHPPPSLLLGLEPVQSCRGVARVFGNYG